MKNLSIVAFLLLVAVQWYVTLDMIRSHQNILLYGDVVTFQITPFWLQGVPQSDVLQVSILQNEIKISDVDGFTSGMDIYVHFEPDEKGILAPVHVLKNRPESGHFLKSRIIFVDEYASSITVSYPQLRYIFPKHDVQAWDIPLTKPFLEGTSVFLAEAKLFEGNAIVTHITIDGMSLLKYFGGEAGDVFD